MTAESFGSISCSILLEEFEPELKKTLVSTQLWSQLGYPVSEEVENRIRDLANTVKQLRTLQTQCWEVLRATKESREAKSAEHIISVRGKPELTVRIIRTGAVGDIIELWKAGITVEGLARENQGRFEEIILKLPCIYLVVKAKHTPLIPFDNLIAVNLEDGASAWIAPETLRTILDLLDNR